MARDFDNEQLAAETLALTLGEVFTLTKRPDTVECGPGDDTILAAKGTLGAGDEIDGGGGNNTLELQGPGSFDLRKPTTLTNLTTVLAQEGQAADIISGAAGSRQTIFLRDGLDVVVNVASDLSPDPLNSHKAGVTIHGAADASTINLGSGADTVFLGSNAETANGGGGADTFVVTAATSDATIDGGSGKSTLKVIGGGDVTMGAHITNIAVVKLSGPPLGQTQSDYRFIANTTAGLTIMGSGGADTIVVGDASQEVRAGAGGALVLATGAQAGVLVKGAASTILEITSGGSATLNAGDRKLATVVLDAAGTLTLNAETGLIAQGSAGADTILAGGKGQTLTGEGGGDTLVGSAAGDDTFKDIAGNLNGATIGGFSAKGDLIDVEDLAFGATATLDWAQNADSGLLTVTDGVKIAAVTLLGQFDAAGFSMAGDGTGGTTVGYAAPPLSLTAALANDTGASATDRVTSDPTIAGLLTEASGNRRISSFRGGLDQTASAGFGDLASSLQSDGSFTLSKSTMQVLAGGSLADGPHTLHLVATDKLGRSSSLDLSFVLQTAPPDTTPPILTAALANDTGSSAADGITSNDTIVGILVDNAGGSGVAVLRGGLDGTAASGFVDLAGVLQPDDTFRLPSTALDTLAGGALADGAHTLHLEGVDKAGNPTFVDVGFTLETVPPMTPVFDLAPSDQAGPEGSGLTQSSIVDLEGTTSPGAMVNLLGTNISTTADSTGAFDLSNVSLIAGDNSLAVRASDAAGNTSTASFDVDREAITVSQVTTQATLTRSNSASIDYHLDVEGLSVQTGQVLIQAYLSPDGQLADAGAALATATISLANLAGVTDYSGQIQLPPSALGSLPFGDYKAILTATLSVDGQSGQLTGSSTSSPLVLQPSYSAKITTPPVTLVAGDSTVLSGIATSNSDGTPVPLAAVFVTISEGTFQETLTTTTDASGHFSVNYHSLVGAEGDYAVSAHNPGLTGEDPTPESMIHVVGLNFAQSQVSIAAATGIPTNGVITIANPSSQALDGVNATISGLPAGWTFTLNDLPTTLAAGSNTVVHYTLDAPSQNSLSSFTVKVAAADGAQDTSTFNVTSQLTSADLKVDASSLTTSVVTGNQTLLTFTITNDGQQAADDVRLSLPQGLAWLQSASPQNLGTIAAGAALTVSLLADPSADVALGEYKGSIALQYGADGGENPTTSVPFDLKVTTDQTGSVAVTLSDEATILTPASPLVQDATVTVTDAAGAVVATYTGVNGRLQIPSLAVGAYNLHISAADHSTINQSIQVTAGQTDQVNAFLPMQVATYSWSVVKSTVTDNYSIVLDSTFETNVPVPVVTINPPTLDFADLGYGQSKIIDVTMTNHGLIAAQDVSLDLPSPPGYVITPLVNSLPEIGAMDSVQVPVTITRLAPSIGNGSSPGASALSRVTPEAGEVVPTTPQQPVKWVVIFPNGGFALVDSSFVLPLLASARPPSIDQTDWSLIEDRLQTRLGFTPWSFDGEIAVALGELSQIGQAPSDKVLSTALAYELNAASGVLPDITLAQTTDIAESGAGIDLALTRIYSASFLNRNSAGAFGDGWTYTFQVRAQTDASGNVYITSAAGSEVFTAQSGGGYVATPGDSSVLTRIAGAFLLTDASGTVERFRPDGQLSSVTDANGNSIALSYDTDGVISRVGDTNGQFLTFTINAQGRITSAVDQNGQTVTYAYDGSGEHLLSATSPAGTTRYSYDSSGNPLVRNALSQVTTPDGTTQTFQYNSQGDLSSQSGPGGAGAVSYGYGAIGTVTETDATGAPTTLVYDANGNLAEAIDASGAVTGLQYDSHGELTGVASPGGGSYQFSYTADGNLRSYTDPNGGTVSATYSPGPDRLTSLADQRGNTTQYHYDAGGDLTEIIQADGKGTTYRYAPSGALTETVDATGQTIQYSYDSSGLLAGKAFSDGTSESYAYDAQGNLTSATAADGGVTHYTLRRGRPARQGDRSERARGKLQLQQRRAGKPAGRA